jgi:hypothetical protein
MIKFNTPYTIENGDTVVFTEGKKGTINGTYTDATLTGSFDGEVLKATFHNKKVNAIGLMEIIFHEYGFDAKWKSGLEPGPMRGKWEGELILNTNQPALESKNTLKLDLYTGLDELSKTMEDLAVQSRQSKEEFCQGFIKFVRENQEYLWLIPAYFQKLNSIEMLIDDGELEGDISGFYSKSQFIEQMSTKIFSKQCMYFDARNSQFAWNEEDETSSFFELILEDMGITLEELIISGGSDYNSDGQAYLIKFVNTLRTVLYATIVRAYYSEEYDNESLGYLIVSPLEDENIRKIEDKISIGDALVWAIEDVLYCFNIDINDEEFDEDWGNYSKNYEKMAEAIGDQESYDFSLIEN